MNEEQLELIIDLLQREKASVQGGLSLLTWTREEFEESQADCARLGRVSRSLLDQKMKTIDATLKSIFQYMLTHGGEE